MNGQKKFPKKAKKTKYEVPDWFKKILPGAHGNTPTQKRAWRIVSEYVRKRDFKLYHGKCVSCSRRLARWQDGQAAHFKTWGASNGFFKYEPTNLAFSCPHCNAWGGGDIGFAFGEELKRRYGPDHLDWIVRENIKHTSEKMEEWDLVAMCEKLL